MHLAEGAKVVHQAACCTFLCARAMGQAAAATQKHTYITAHGSGDLVAVPALTDGPSMKNASREAAA